MKIKYLNSRSIICYLKLQISNNYERIDEDKLTIKDKKKETDVGRKKILQNVYKRLQLYTLSSTSQQHHSGIILDEKDKERISDQANIKNTDLLSNEEIKFYKLTFYNKNTKLKKPVFITKDELIKPIKTKKEVNEKRVIHNKIANNVELRIDGIGEDLSKQYVLNINTFTPASELSDQIRLEPIHPANKIESMPANAFQESRMLNNKESNDHSKGKTVIRKKK